MQVLLQFYKLTFLPGKRGHSAAGATAMCVLVDHPARREALLHCKADVTKDLGHLLY